MNHEINIKQAEHFQAEALVTDYLSASQNDDPLLYPGQRPEGSYLTDGHSIYSLTVRNNEGNLSFTMKTDEGEVEADAFLSQFDAPTMHERIPVLAFGANMSPGSLGSKFKKIGRPDALVIPTVYASLEGHDVVWSGAPGMNGNFIAILYKGQETSGTNVQVGVNFLTREQLIVMNATELNYELSSVDVDVEGAKIKTYYYAGRDSVLLQEGMPVAIDSIPAEGRNLPESNTRDLLDELLANDKLSQEFLNHSPDFSGSLDSVNYIKYVKSLREQIGARTELKKFMHDLALENGLSKYVDNPDAVKGIQSWANPSTIPTYGEQLSGIWHHETIKFANEELGQWGDLDARKKVLKSIATHYRRRQGK